MSRPSAPRWLGDPFASVADSVFNGSHEGIVVIDERQHIVMVNPAALRMLGCVASEALGQDLGHFIPAHRHAAHVGHMGQLHESAASAPAEWLPPQVASLVGRRANGEEFPVAVTISRVDVAGELGTRHCFTALLRDLSAEHDQQAEVQALNARLRGIFDLAPTAIWIADGESIVYANRACVGLFGAADRDDLVGRSMYSVLKAESHATVKRQVALALSVDRPIPCLTERIARLDGGERDVEIAVAALPDHGRSTVQMVINDITERARTGRELEQSRARMQQLAAHQIQALEEERQRIARELHDELGQRLTALKLELVRCAREPTSAATGPAVDHLLAMVDDTVAAVRRLATDLRPAMLDDLGLNAAVEWLGRESSLRMGVEVAVHLDSADPPLGQAAAVAVYRMVQEALTNVARHAHARSVRIELHCERGVLLLEVEDDGIGFSGPAAERDGSHGLAGMRERARLFGGTVEVGNAPSGGGRVTVRLPLWPAGPLNPAGPGA
ncbi:MAG: PAS domain S-box protein [Ideonella sp.]|nr:PAS domain S-box protein [Ideonella sp.]